MVSCPAVEGSRCQGKLSNVDTRQAFNSHHVYPKSGDTTILLYLIAWEFLAMRFPEQMSDFFDIYL